MTSTSTGPESVRAMSIRERIDAAIEGRLSADAVIVTLKRARDALDAADRKVRVAEQDRDRFSREACAARRERDDERAASNRLREALRDLVDARHRGPR